MDVEIVKVDAALKKGNKMPDNEQEEIGQDRMEGMKKLNEIADSIIVKSLVDNGLTEPDMQRLKVKFNLLLENKEELELLNYTNFLYMMLKSTLIRSIINSAMLRKLEEEGKEPKEE